MTKERITITVRASSIKSAQGIASALATQLHGIGETFQDAEITVNKQSVTLTIYAVDKDERE